MAPIRKKRLLLAVSAGVVLGMATTMDNDFEIAKNLEIFSNVFRELNTYYVDEIDPEKTMRSGMDAMLRSLDPYTVYIAPEDVDNFQSSITGRYAGVGATVGTRDGYAVITELYEQGPAQRSGLRVGDYLVAADGVSLRNKTTREVSEQLRGISGTVVEIEVQRQNEAKNLKLQIKREEIRIPNVPYYDIVGDNIAYIVLSTFTENAGKNITSALMELKARKPIQGVILDLRDNTGGLLSEAVNAANVFVKKGELVVQIRGKDKDQNKTFRTLNHATELDLPLAVLINKNSASASEIVAGAIQDLDRGVVIGQRSYGKGLVQNTHDVGYGAKVKLTSARYYIPSGRCIQSSQYKDGKPIHIADSLRVAFKTRNGRTVYDGGGVLPDVATESKDWAKIREHLERQLMVFDFVTDYQQKHPSIAPAASFALGDADFKAFIEFLQKKNYSFITQTEQQLAELEKKAKDEQYYDQIKSELDDMKRLIERDKAQELREYKAEIMHWLQSEIVRRYYFERGSLENGATSDPEVQRAIAVLRDTKIYNQTLAKQ